MCELVSTKGLTAGFRDFLFFLYIAYFLFDVWGKGNLGSR